MPFAKCIAAGDVLFWLQKRTRKDGGARRA